MSSARPNTSQTDIVKLKIACAARVPVLARDHVYHNNYYIDITCKSAHGAKMRSCAQHVPNCANAIQHMYLYHSEYSLLTCTLQDSTNDRVLQNIPSSREKVLTSAILHSGIQHKSWLLATHQFLIHTRPLLSA